jgi:hypothetical protein
MDIEIEEEKIERINLPPLMLKIHENIVSLRIQC